MIAPCKGCQDRELGCHGKCERYKEYKVVIDQRRKQEQLYNEAINANITHMLKAKAKSRR